MTHSDLIRRRWTYPGLAVALLGLPAITLCYRVLVGDTKSTYQLVLRETAIFVLLGLLLLLIRRGERLPLSSISLVFEKMGRPVLWGLLAFVLLAVGTAAALGLLQLLGLKYGGGRTGFVPPLWATALVVLRAGIVEEVFYRGYAIERIQSLSGHRWLAASIPLVAFASSHYQQGIAGVVVALVLGGILTALYFWRRSLVSNIIGHFLIDFVPNVLLPVLSA